MWYSIRCWICWPVCDMVPGTVHVIADAHIYDRHIPLVEELITRPTYAAPTFKLNPEIKNFYDFTVRDITVENYEAGPQITNIPVAI
ncbi:MAG: thymidylate synthase [Eisenbergiella sp.]